MGVYIAGMEMPKSCLVCCCTDTEYGECALDPEKRCPEDYHKRADWCPLVNIPPHSDLIDRTALRWSRMLMEFDKCDGDNTEHVRREFYWADAIDGAPVVIPRG